MKSTHSALWLLAALTTAAVLACEAAGPSPASTTPRASASDADALPSGAFTAFLPSERCAVCHSAAPSASALTTATGDDVSPFETWSATAMANSFRDPYWRAQMAREVELAPQRREEIEAQCLTCHAPMSHHSSRLGGGPAPTLAGALASPLAEDGVSCTVCHRTQPHELGQPSTFNGNLPVGHDDTIFGPYKDPTQGPMRAHTGFTPTHGAHIQSSALCGSCHTLFTHAHGGAPFLEQGPYLEWRNSVYSDESGATSLSRSCQECHMPDVGSMKIARNPRGFDFNIAVRPDVRAHTFVGGNTLLIELLRDNADALGVTATQKALERVLDATRAQLAHSTARVSVVAPRRSSDALEFDVRVENLAGHKLPSGYPARRAWLRVHVRAGGQVLFDSGAFDDRGRLSNVADELALPHFDRIESSDQVQVYELVAVDASGRPTTSLGAMTRPIKDNRLLPRGWKRDGPHAAETKPVGVDDDDFSGGSDTVSYRVSLPAETGDVIVTVWLHYQPIPPHWAEALRSSKSAEATSFLAMYEAADPRPETAALAIEVIEP